MNFIKTKRRVRDFNYEWVKYEIKVLSGNHIAVDFG